MNEKAFVPELVALLSRASIEIAAGHPRTMDTLHDQFDPGTEVFVNFTPSGDYPAVAETAAQLRRAGFNPVAHIAARGLASAAALTDFLSRLSGEAGVDRVLLISGDRNPALGPFNSSMDLLRTGLFEKHGVRFVGIAGQPEGHPKVASAVLDAALQEKCAHAVAAGLAPFIVTQFCFEARPILEWLGRIRRAGIDAPVRLGVAGPATVATLIKFGERCGVGDSLKAIRARTNLAGGSLGISGPEDLLRDLATGLAAFPGHGVSGVHFFPFGGVAKTGDFIARTLARLYGDITPGGTVPA